MTLGGEIPANRASGIKWIPYTGGGSYGVSVTQIKRGSNPIPGTSRDYRSTIVDSGTSFTYLPANTYNSVRDYFIGANPSGTKVKGESSDDYCFRRPWSEIAKLD